MDCLECLGTGIEGEAKFPLPATRSYEIREVTYTPKQCGRGRASGVLKIQTAMKERYKRTYHEYQLAEIRCDGGGRGFVVQKARRPDRLHHVETGPDGVRCSCEGETYQTTAKHNQKAWEAGQEIFPGYGCKHADAIVALLNRGWFD